MIAAYNAQDADTYVAYMTDDACEAGYRGDVVREGKEAPAPASPPRSPAGRRTAPRSAMRRRSAITC
jgi:hypothetical protein